MTYLERFGERVLQDALAEALPVYWRGRAEAFRQALPREGDFHGQSTRRERARRKKRIEALIQECEKRAEVREELGQDWWVELFREVRGGESRG